MVTNVEIISKEMIKPSSPTPPHLRNLKLSFLDQIAPPVYVPLIFFYHHDELNHNINRLEISRLLKQSLSNILTIFYPLGGRIQENSLVDCNDSGAEFIEARVNTRLSEVIQEPNMEELKKLEPVEPLGQDEKVVLAVKLSFFDCGGITIAISLSHKIADGMSLVAFINAWAAICCGKSKMFKPSFNFASFFPPRAMPGLGSTEDVGMTKEKLATKRFVFDKEKLAKLKEFTASSDGGSQVKDPTRVEAVSAYIWRRFMEVAKAKGGMKTSFAAVHAVNLRPKNRPPFSENAFGNCWRPAIAMSKPEDNSDLVTKLRVAIRSINDDYIKKVENGEYLNNLIRSVDMYLKGGMEFCNFSSWCRFPVYEVDFGWGKPVWVCTTTLPFKNVVILMSTPCGEGIEAWVNMLEDDMKMFEEHQNLIDLVSQE
ncbi:hypothetical protein Pfo_020316 [Paulownia fortunei]|nr:hypothetical protein Pfo_020316 [Paulownia fortunei]